MEMPRIYNVEQSMKVNIVQLRGRSESPKLPDPKEDRGEQRGFRVGR
jgi:hypothetical protein